MSRPPSAPCPRCGSDATIRIAYGLPGPGLMEAADRGEVALGGCCIEADQPDHKCTVCDAAFAGEGNDPLAR